MPSEESLRNPGGPAYTLRKHSGDDLWETGYRYTTNDFPGSCTSVGHVYFHPGTRGPPTPPYAELQAFIAANPSTPVVVSHSPPGGNSCEVPHILFARLEVASDNQAPIVHLFTVAADNRGIAFDPATHVKNGTQYEGVNVLDWSMCNFDKCYQAVTLPDTYGKILEDLHYSFE